MNIQIVRNLLLTAVFSILLSACATSAISEAERTLAYEQFIKSNKLESIKRITSFNFYSWTSLGDEHLIINTRFNKPYLITLQSSCYDLSFANTLVIHRNGSSLHTKFDAISVMGPMSVKCFIKSIYPLNKEQVTAVTKIGHEEEKPSEENIIGKESVRE